MHCHRAHSLLVQHLEAVNCSEVDTEQKNGSWNGDFYEGFMTEGVCLGLVKPVHEGRIYNGIGVANQPDVSSKDRICS
jgi:hypothetical protein